MNQKRREKLKENTERLLSEHSSPTSKNPSDVLIIESIKFLAPSKRRKKLLLLVFIGLFLLYFFVLIKNGRVISNFMDIVKEVSEIVIPTFAVVITGYAIFQALANGSTLINLIIVNGKKGSKFEEYNLFFLGVSILYLFIMLLNLVLFIIFKNIPKEWCIKSLSIEANNALASLLIAFYLTFIINAIIELKSFIYNLYQCFNINAASETINYLKEPEETKK
ncbi:hypothetical protein AT864_01521 [Anoxybacillus sp. P3H1B]|uniref:hypothetical protein n=1 Tax=Anoxybacillus sp. P3H1B TaxID=1769293 RepID=UPI000791C993|nr:hypothetical protein [Anoxybacillus sp. P3H1B]KXG09961.1 hypothetical protein AT864_01521 [Anoxybacillus sp. P3H1B]